MIRSFLIVPKVTENSILVPGYNWVHIEAHQSTDDEGWNFLVGLGIRMQLNTYGKSSFTSER